MHQRICVLEPSLNKISFKLSLFLRLEYGILVHTMLCLKQIRQNTGDILELIQVYNITPSMKAMLDDVSAWISTCRVELPWCWPENDKCQRMMELEIFLKFSIQTCFGDGAQIPYILSTLIYTLIIHKHNTLRANQLRTYSRTYKMHFVKRFSIKNVMFVIRIGISPS